MGIDIHTDCMLRHSPSHTVLHAVKSIAKKSDGLQETSKLPCGVRNRHYGTHPMNVPLSYMTEN